MKKIISITLFSLPFIASAQNASVQSLVYAFGLLLKNLIPTAVAVALLFFFWGLAKFIRASGDEKAIEEGKRTMIWGVVALFVMVSVWGLVYLLQNTLLGGSPTYNLPFQQP